MDALHPVRYLAVVACLWQATTSCHSAFAQEAANRKPTAASIRGHFIGHWQRSPNEDDAKVEIVFGVWQKAGRHADQSPIPPTEEQLRAGIDADLPESMASSWRRVPTEHRYYDASGLAVELSRFGADKPAPDVITGKTMRIESVGDRFYLVLRQDETESWYVIVPPGKEPPRYDPKAKKPFDEKSLAARGIEDAYFEQSTQYRLEAPDRIRLVILDWGGLPAPRMARTYRRVAKPPEWAAASIDKLRQTHLAQRSAAEPAANARDAESDGKTAKNSIGMDLVRIPAGEFLMGNPTYKQEERKEHEGPPHRVRITKPFLLGKYEVTQAEYEAVMGRNPSYLSSGGEGKAKVNRVDTRRLPVESVSWYDALLFCNRLSEKEGLPPYYKLDNRRDEESDFLGKVTVYTKYDVTVVGGEGYRLPTEAEWEYACRAGTNTRFSFGDVSNGRKANVNGGYPLGTDEKGPSRELPLNVGSFEPNAFGLHDMHGNVWEWCFDVSDETAYANRRDVTEDPAVGGDKLVAGPRTSHVVRGGDWQSSAKAGTSYYRFSTSPAYRSRSNGFRVARTP